MYKLLAIVVIAACVYAEQSDESSSEKTSPCLGCPFEANANGGEDVLPTLKVVLKLSGLNEEVKSIDNVTEQVTGGMFYQVKFTSVSGKECAASWLSRPWQTKDPIEPKASCQ